MVIILRTFQDRFLPHSFQLITDSHLLIRCYIMFWLKGKYNNLKLSGIYILNHTMKIDNSSIERVEEFKYLGTTLTNQNSLEEEIKSRLKLGNACYHSVQKLLSSSLLSKNLKIKIYRTIKFCLLFCMDVKLGR